MKRRFIWTRFCSSFVFVPFINFNNNNFYDKVGETNDNWYDEVCETNENIQQYEPTESNHKEPQLYTDLNIPN